MVVPPACGGTRWRRSEDFVAQLPGCTILAQVAAWQPLPGSGAFLALGHFGSSAAAATAVTAATGGPDGCSSASVPHCEHGNSRQSQRAQRARLATAARLTRGARRARLGHVWLGAEEHGGGNRRVCCPIPWLHPGHYPGAGVGEATTALQLGLLGLGTIWIDDSALIRVPEEIRRRDVTSARRVRSRLDANFPLAPAAIAARAYSAWSGPGRAGQAQACRATVTSG
jgi:hypothetical protein